jgi:hypothetical protein
VRNSVVMTTRLRALAARGALVGGLAIFSWVFPTSALAQRAERREPVRQEPARQFPAGAPDARETRDALRAVLAQYPPTLAQVLRLDPTLLTRPDYVASYPALATFLTEHPEVARSPAYFFGDPPFFRGPDTVRSEAVRSIQDVMMAILALSALTVFMLSLGWLIRTALADRRWQRLAKTQTETHGKLLDRLTSHDDLVAYIQSPSGKRFLDAAPIMLDETARAPVSAPVARILWSIQAGVVLVAVGLGLFFAKNQVFEEIGSALYVMGIVTVSLGIGFVASALVAYALSHRLGLMNTAAAHDA